MLFLLLMAQLCLSVVIKQDENVNITSIPSRVCSIPTRHYENGAVKENLIKYANYCALSYCIPGNRLQEGSISSACILESCTESERNKEVIYQFNELISGLIIEDDTNKELSMVFKGTSTQDEWVVDFETSYDDYIPYSVQEGINTIPFDCEGCIVHSGFYRAIKVFMSTGFPKVVEFASKHPDYSISVVGHSLGAALAILGANELRLMGLDITLINYAGPKVGNLNFGNWMDSMWNTQKYSNALQEEISYLPKNTFTRVVNKGDIVPLAPPLALGFAHCGCGIQLNSKSRMTLLGKWKKCYEALDLKDVSRDALKMIQSGNWEKAMGLNDVSYKHTQYFLKVNECTVNKRQKVSYF